MIKIDEKNFEEFLRQFRFRAPKPLPLQESSPDRYSGGASAQLSPGIRIVIADDHELFRKALSGLLNEESGLEVIGEARDGAEAVELTQKLRPDILLLDLRMPNHPGLESLKNLGSAPGPNETRVILLTAEVSKRQIVEALQLGARGVVLKDSATEVLLKGIETVMGGGYWVGRERVANLVQYLRSLIHGSGEEARQRRYGLTARELEIVSAVVGGYTNKDIALHFKISEDTVKHHLSNIFDKLGVATRLELALFAVNKAVPLPNIVCICVILALAAECWQVLHGYPDVASSIVSAFASWVFLNVFWNAVPGR